MEILAKRFLFFFLMVCFDNSLSIVQAFYQLWQKKNQIFHRSVYERFIAK
jgi:hypothetical protein